MHATVRSGGLEDAAQLAVLRWESRRDDERDLEHLDSFGSRFHPWLRDALESQNWQIAVATVNERLIGCMYLRRVDTVPVPGSAGRAWGYITHAFVAQGHRNAGIGRELLSWLIARARAMGLIELHVWPSQGAISLYTQMGFQSPEAQRQAASPDEPSYVLPLEDDGGAPAPLNVGRP